MHLYLYRKSDQESSDSYDIKYVPDRVAGETFDGACSWFGFVLLVFSFVSFMFSILRCSCFGSWRVGFCFPN